MMLLGRRGCRGILGIRISNPGSSPGSGVLQKVLGLWWRFLEGIVCVLLTSIF